MENMYDKFVNLYPVSKTLKFELIPQGKTLEKMKENLLLNDDEHRAESYKRVKELIDQYNKIFIEKCLKNYKIDTSELEKYYKIICNKTKDVKEFEDITKTLRKGISEVFTKHEDFKKLFGKEMINQFLPCFTSDKKDLSVLEEFSKFTTYLKGFNENRKNMYSAEDKSTAIAYRLVNENLPIFISNMQSFKYIYEVFPKETTEKIYKDLEEIIQVEELKDMFELEYFNDVLTQKGIDIYNQIIGGFAKSDGTKIKGINEYVNEYKQKNPSDKKISKLSVLYKQILSEKETASFVIDNINNDIELVDILNELSNNIKNKVLNKDNNLEKLLQSISNYDLEKIYIKNDLSITEISQYLYGDWSVISQALKDDYDKTYGTEKSMKSKNYEENRSKYLKSRSNFSIKYLDNITANRENFRSVSKYFEESLLIKDSDPKEKTDSKENLNNCLFDDSKEKSITNIFKRIDANYKKLVTVLDSNLENINMKEEFNKITIIKDYLDSLKELQSLIKPLLKVRYETDYEKDNKFYDELIIYWDAMNELNGIYNKVRNYLTGKPYSTNKIKLNFNNPTLLAGWDVNKETDNKSIILKKDEMYYLAILSNEFKGQIQRSEECVGEYYEKMEYKLLPGPNKMLPHVFFCDKNIDTFKPSEELLDKYKKGFHKKGKDFDIDFCHELIDFFKKSISQHTDWNKFDFEFTDTKKYKDISEFYREVEHQGYKIKYSKIEENYIDQLIEEGKLYLFQIYNKDFSKYSKGKPNLHTMYWKALFDKENLENIVYKLNGEAEIFYRKASIKRDITHSKNIKLKNKNSNNKKSESVFEYDLVKDKRFSEDKFQFHVPITMNFRNIGISNINQNVNLAIKNNKENYIIGIDRGERHLLYLVLINSRGDIIKQYSLNSIINEFKGSEYETNYHDLLDNKEKEREKARESWQSIENIKELNKGYLSQVINKITDLMIKYNAIVVLEDLNFGFMRGRQKVEKQVYQKFEKMLIDKLNYLVKKDKEKNETGGLLKAYQLTNEFKSFRTLGKQNGMMYYIPAWNTSKMDPVTGFVNLFYVKYENETNAKSFAEKIDSIIYNDKDGYFEFDIDYNKFTLKADGTKTKWTLCTYGERIKTFRNKDKNSQWDNEKVDLTNEFKKLFEKFNINFNNSNIKEKILKIEGKEFWENFIFLFKLMVQMRNSITGNTEDYLISPVKGPDGTFFNSKNCLENLPKDADANGAYNIARKGLWVVNQIKNTPDDKMNKIKLAISNKDWLKFVQNKEYEG